jgi:sugar/nucleoside kinase (ribokinase family)
LIQARPSVLGVGTVSLDTVESRGEVARDVLGGSAAYFAAAARVAADVAIVGVVGQDFPERFVTRMSEAGIDVSGLSRHPGETFRWHVRYARDGNRETVSTNRETALTEIPQVPDDRKGPAALFLGSTDPSIQASVLAQAGAPELVVLDTMTHWIRERGDDLRLLMRSADVVLLNEEEALLLGEGDQAGGVRPILEQGCSWVVVKRGDQGAIAFGHDRAIAVSAPRPREVKDPTGAGDAFGGGLVATLARDWPSPTAMDEALKQAAAMGSLAVESFSVDRLLAATQGGVDSRAREARLKMRKHRPAP